MTCRICSNPHLYKAIDLGSQKLTGVFPGSKEEASSLHEGSVVLVKCDDSANPTACGLLQIESSFAPEMMYGETYGYRSGLNKSMVKHLHSKVDRIIFDYDLREGDLVIDIGSNDATTLNHYPKTLRRVGVDPTGEKYSTFYDDGVELISDFFSKEVLVGADLRNAKVITSFSMFYDLEEPVQFAQDIADTLRNDGVWIFEQSYLPFMLLSNSFDTACHEHVEYYSLKNIIHILDTVGLKVIHHEFNDINGGSISITAAKVESPYMVDSALANILLEEELEYGLSDPVTYRNFQKRVDALGEELVALLNRLKAAGKRVAGIGASTKGNVLLQYYGITKDLVESIGEVNPDKFGCLTPGTEIPIVPEDEILRGDYDYLVVLPWHFRSFFEGNSKFTGQKLIFPLPNVEIVAV